MHHIHHLVAIMWLHLQVMWPVIILYTGWLFSIIQRLASCQKVWEWYQKPETFPVYRVGQWAWQQIQKLWRRFLSTLRQFQRK